MKGDEGEREREMKGDEGDNNNNNNDDDDDDGKYRCDISSRSWLS